MLWLSNYNIKNNVLIPLCLGIFLVMIIIIPNAFANEFGTISTEKSVYEVAADRNILVKLYGFVENPRQGTWVEMVVTHPDDSTSNLKTPKTSNGYYETYINVGYEDRGNYSVSAQFIGNDIGTVTFEVTKYGSEAAEQAAEQAAAEAAAEKAKIAAEREAAAKQRAEEAAAEKAAAAKTAAAKAAAEKEVETQTQSEIFTTTNEDLRNQMGMEDPTTAAAAEAQGWAMLQYAKETGQYIDPFQQSVRNQKAAAQQAWENKPFFEKHSWIIPLLMLAAIIAGIVGTVVAIIRKRGKNRQVIQVAPQQSRTQVRTKQTSAFCETCGNPLKPHYKFCNSCGSEI